GPTKERGGLTHRAGSQGPLSLAGRNVKRGRTIRNDTGEKDTCNLAPGSGRHAVGRADRPRSERGVPESVLRLRYGRDTEPERRHRALRVREDVERRRLADRVLDGVRIVDVDEHHGHEGWRQGDLH